MQLKKFGPILAATLWPIFKPRTTEFWTRIIDLNFNFKKIKQIDLPAWILLLTTNFFLPESSKNKKNDFL